MVGLAQSKLVSGAIALVKVNLCGSRRQSVTQGRSIPLRQELPHGLLFLLYDLMTILVNNAEVARIADQISLFCNHLCKLHRKKPPLMNNKMTTDNPPAKIGYRDTQALTSSSSLQPRSEPSRPTPRCWRFLGPPSRALSARR